MSARLRMTPVPELPEQQAVELPAPDAQAVPAHAYLARLAALHDEAAETAHLANLLGRAPWAAGLLGLSALATAFFFARSVSPVPLAVWLVLVTAAVAPELRDLDRLGERVDGGIAGGASSEMGLRGYR